MPRFPIIAAAFMAGAFLSACGGGGGAGSFNPNTAQRSDSSAATSASAVTPQEIVVTNAAGNTAQVYNAAGKLLRTISKGLSAPDGVAIDAAGKIYVSSSNEMTSYDADGKRTTPTITGTLPLMTGVALAENGKKIFLTNTGKVGHLVEGTVTAYTATGKATTPTFNTYRPQGLAVDASGNIYVTGGGSVAIYDATGTLINTIVNGLFDPEGIAVDAAGKIYVANNLNNTVTTYNPDGTQTVPTISVNGPWGVAVDARGKIYVTSVGNNNVTTYNPDGTQTTPTVSGLNEPKGIAIH
jgi:sugar lactone lactonase YvrE